MGVCSIYSAVSTRRTGLLYGPNHTSNPAGSGISFRPWTTGRCTSVVPLSVAFVSRSDGLYLPSIQYIIVVTSGTTCGFVRPPRNVVRMSRIRQIRTVTNVRGGHRAAPTSGRQGNTALRPARRFSLDAPLDLHLHLDFYLCAFQHVLNKSYNLRPNLKSKRLCYAA